MIAILAAALLTAAAAAASVCALRRRIAVVTVSGTSMLPTLRSGDRVLIRRASVDQLRTGQVVVLEQPRGDFVPASPPPHWPPSRREWLIKRVVAVPGEPLPETMQAAPGVAGSPVPPGKLLILGDNGAVSLDSRLLGYIDAERILGIMIRPMRTQHG